MGPGSSSGPRAGAVAVAVAVAVRPVVPAAPPPAAAGTAVVPVVAAGAAVVPVVAAGAAAAAPPAPAPMRAWSPVRARVAWAKGLFALGCAAAALAFFAMALPPAASSPGLLGACAPTDAEAADLRAASTKLLLAASAQVLAATVVLRVPVMPVAGLAWLLSCLTAYRTVHVVGMLVACHDQVHGALAAYYWLFFAMLLLAFLVDFPVSIRQDQ